MDSRKLHSQLCVKPKTLEAVCVEVKKSTLWVQDIARYMNKCM